MKKQLALLALFVLFFTGAAFANSAIVTSLTGTVQVQTGTAAARTLRQGDEVRQGDTVITAAASSVILKFQDGQVAALTANSRMAINTYQYNANTGAGSVLLSLLNGGMRAITGLIGRAQPSQVAYRAGTATIGIRGTDTSVYFAGGDIVVTVSEGAVTFAYAGRSVIIRAGEGVNARRDGTFQQGAAQQIIRTVPPDIAALVGGLQGLTEAIQQAAKPPGQTGQPGQPGGDTGQPGLPPGQTPSPNNPPGGAGGGSASNR